MSNKQLGQKGFSVVEVIMVIVIVGLLVSVGYLFYKGRHKANTATKPATKTAAPATKATADPYAGWKTGTLKYDKISYKYPVDWKVEDKSVATNKGDCVYPGIDNVLLTSPHNRSVVLHAGIYCIGDGEAAAYGADSMSALGQNVYLVYQNYKDIASDSIPSGPAFACLGPSKDPGTPFSMLTKNITTESNGKPEPTAAQFCYFLNKDGGSGEQSVTTVSAIQKSDDFATAKLILESLTY